ncbi:amino acid permease [Flavobacterium sp. '19STA2R22 D10 B1']|uniref:amino acid permease n=1 Tax=Flavobacterium aerium TaxID=3037261 RepID=UPI00278C1517|nr:amino acid permease [Flavobacterium sp. '19STA2R22 D10 B1']
MAFSNLFRKKTVENILASANEEHSSLAKHLGVRDLTGFGIAAIIGAGIFSTIGRASYEGGPAVVFLFLFTAIACAFTAFAYAEFASLVPVSGSAYTYSYVAFGELFAWIIGWALIMEYAIGNIVVAISWSDYFTALVNGIPGLHIPEWMTMDYFTAKNGFEVVNKLLQNGHTLESIAASEFAQEIPKYLAYANAPQIGFNLVLDIPALLITFLITALVYRGINESRKASNMMVVIKIVVVLLVIVVGSFYVNTDNWDPFAPNGIAGVLGGISSVFFAYIGFDAISTTAEECKNPQRDLPRGIFYSIIICTVLYIAIALVITGLVSYSELNVGDPLAFVFSKIQDLKWLGKVVAVSAVVAMASVFVIFQLGQPRIWMTMSRDGLLPKAFSRVHPKFKTPSFATIFTGFVVGVPILFTDLNLVVDVCSIGTLFAFVLVCAGVLKLESTPNGPRGKFKTPYLNSAYVMPLIFVVTVFIAGYFFRTETMDFVNNKPVMYNAEALVSSLDKEELKLVAEKIATINGDQLDANPVHLEKYLKNLGTERYSKIVDQLPLNHDQKYESGLALFKHKIPMWVFIFIALFMTYKSITRKMSFIPLAGMLCCFYMMAELGWKNWVMFLIWLALGLVMYFTYGVKNSMLNKANMKTQE